MTVDRLGVLGRKPEKLEKLGRLLNQSVYCHDMLHPHSPKKFLLDSSPQKLMLSCFLMNGRIWVYIRKAGVFFSRIHAKQIIPTKKREVFIFKTSTTLPAPPKQKQISTIIYHLTAPHFFKILSSFPPNKHLCYLGLGVVGRSGDGRVASRVDAFPRSLRSSALDLSATHTTSTI